MLQGRPARVLVGRFGASLPASDPETVAFDYARLRKLIDQYAPKGKTIPIISGEWGYSSAWKTLSTRPKQGKMLPRELLDESGQRRAAVDLVRLAR